MRIAPRQSIGPSSLSSTVAFASKSSKAGCAAVGGALSIIRSCRPVPLSLAPQAACAEATARPPREPQALSACPSYSAAPGPRHWPADPSPPVKDAAEQVGKGGAAFDQPVERRALDHLLHDPGFEAADRFPGLRRRRSTPGARLGLPAQGLAVPRRCGRGPGRGRTSSSRVVFSSQAAPSRPSRTMRWIVSSKPSPGKVARGRRDRPPSTPRSQGAVGELDHDQHRGREAAGRRPRGAQRRLALPPSVRTQARRCLQDGEERRRTNDERKARVSTACTDSSSESQHLGDVGVAICAVLLEGRGQVGDLALGRLLELAVEVERDRDLGRQ